MGYGVVKKEGSKLFFITCGATEVKEKEAGKRLIALRKKLNELIKRYSPSAAGIEKLYFAKNKKTAIAVAEARGVMLLCLSQAKVPILEFDPTDVKRTVAGDGHCDKKTLAKMVCLSLGVKELPGPDDASDALAIAIRASFEV